MAAQYPQEWEELHHPDSGESLDMAFVIVPEPVSADLLGLGAVALLGLAAILGTATPVLVVPLFVWALAVKFIPAEERAMERTFGQAYRQYRQRVRKWL